MRRKLFSGIFSILFISGLAILAQFFAIKILTERSVHDVALWAIFEALTAFLMAIGVWGGESSVINRCSGGRDTLSGALAHSFILIFAALILGLPVIWVISYYAKIGAAQIIVIYIAAIFASLCFVISIHLRATQRFALSSIIERLNIFGFFILILSVTYMGYSFGVDVLIVCSSMLALFLASCLFFIRVDFDLLGGKLFKLVRQVLTQDKAAHFSLTNFIIFLYERLDQFIILALLAGW